MADVRTNIFGIGEVYELQREGLWVEKNRESFREFGYFGGSTPADTPGPGSQVERIDYSNDLASPQNRLNGSGIIYSVGMSNAKF